jgi:hypothetical protein
MAGGGPGMRGPGGQGGMMQAMQAQQQAQMQQMQARGPGGAGMPGAQGMAMAAGRGAGMPGPGMAGAPGLGGAAGGAGRDEPADFSDPQGAAKAFLDALKSKDLDRLAEATALRSQAEAATKNQEIFKRILDGSLSESELADLSKKLDGYSIIGENPARSTGKLQIVIRKNEGTTSYQRVITVRKERKGWGVLDISGPGEIKQPRMVYPRTRTPARR